MNRFTRLNYFYRGLLISILLLFCFSIPFLYSILPIITGDRGFAYTVKPGDPVQRLIDALAREGYLRYPIIFKLYVFMRGLSGKIQVGEYFFPPNTSTSKLMSMLVHGKVIQYKFTLVEGWSFAELFEQIKKQPKIKKTLRSREEARSAIGNGNYKNLEGLFFPSTYCYVRDTTDREILNRAHRQLLKRLENTWHGRKKELPYTTPYEALIVASLIEKETADSEERYLIASVILNRLAHHMFLQIDPTIRYGAHKRYDKPLSASDYALNTPYNTYLNKGLPPTPIALPSQASINAALNPGKSNYLYFVLKENGKHQFSNTLDDHVKAVAQYKRVIKSKHTSQRVVNHE